MASQYSYQTTILLVDDCPAGRLVGTLMAEHLGYSVEAMENAFEAIEIVKTAKQPFLAILMDIEMPDMDGFEATNIIRALDEEKGHHNTIIAVTAHAMKGDRQRCLDAGMDDYISKPVSPTIFEQKLAKLANGYSHPLNSL